ncbi:MAG: PaaI family thioesterase [Sedimentisphaerales bacterium]|nr:PaaI family thioesterase [Sedimentisphaerales bacterium]
MITEKQQRCNCVGQQVHPDCVVCSPKNTQGLRLNFHSAQDGQVVAEFNFDQNYQGYPGILHGGVVSAILDGAMTNCLFAQNRVALTADLRIRYRHPVRTDQPASVRAWITRTTPPIFEVKAEITQNQQVTTIATAKFMEDLKLTYSAKS